MLPISVVVPFCEKDRQDAVRLLEWIIELGRVDARCFLLADNTCRPEELLPLAARAFSEAKVWIHPDVIDSKWKSSFNTPGRDASGPNSIFRQAAWECNLQSVGPWLFLEPDAVPLCRDWLDRLCGEYALAAQKAKPFMGARVDEKTHPGSIGVVLHMSGVAVYPQRTPSLARSLVMPSSVAFDVMGAGEVVPHAHFTELIQHHFRAPSFTSMQQVEARLNPNAVIYHANKDGSLIPFLRQKLKGGDASCGPSRVSLQSNGAPNVQPAGAPTCDIFIKTYPKDCEWLKYCLRSIDKFATGFRRIVIQSPLSLRDEAQGINTPITVVSEVDIEPGYLWQQAAKLHADKYTDADFILYMDSDCLFTRPVSPQDFMTLGMAKWEMGIPREDQKNTWFPVMEKFLGKSPQFEFMRRHPFMVPRWALAEIRQFCRYRHGCDLADYIMGQAVAGNPLALTFSEWNCLGFFLHEHHRSKISWMPENSAKWPSDCVRQFWSHGGMKPEHVDEMESILSGGGNGVRGEPATRFPIHPVETPIAVSIDDAIECLVREAHGDGFAKARVLKYLRQAGLVKGGKLRDPKKPKAPVDHSRDFLIAIQTYPGANAGLKRHWPFIHKSGASRFVAITTIDGGCEVPEGCEEVMIGDDKYIAGDHLPQRYIDILKWCLKQPQDYYVISEWDVLFFKPLKRWDGICLVPSGGKLPDSKASTFFHCPHLIDRASAERLIPEMEEIIREGHCRFQWPEASPDVFLSYAIDRTGLAVNTSHFTHWTRNSWDIEGDEKKACEAIRNGVDAVHGCKTEQNLVAVVAALK